MPVSVGRHILEALLTSSIRTRGTYARQFFATLQRSINDVPGYSSGNAGFTRSSRGKRRLHVELYSRRLNFIFNSRFFQYLSSSLFPPDANHFSSFSYLNEEKAFQATLRDHSRCWDDHEGVKCASEGIRKICWYCYSVILLTSTLRTLYLRRLTLKSP